MYARARHGSGYVPGFVDGSALEYTGQYTGYASNNNKNNACPDEPSVGSLNGETKVEAEDCYLGYCNADVIDELAEVVKLIESAFKSLLQPACGEQPQATH